MCFVALSDAATFSEASEKLYISQSSFSNNIQTLEKELGVSLVIRERGTLAFTEEGSALLRYAMRIVEEYRHIKDVLSAYKQSADDRVSIYIDPLSSYGFNDVLASFKTLFPEIQTEIVELSNESFSDILRGNKDVLGMVFSTKKTSYSGTKCHTLVSDRLASLVGTSHRLARSKRISLNDIREEKVQIISHRQSQFLNEFTQEQFRIAGFLPNIAPFDLWYNTMREPIRDLGIIAILPEVVAKIFCQPDMRVVGINAEKFYINLVVSDNCTNRAALRFFEFATEFDRDVS